MEKEGRIPTPIKLIKDNKNIIAIYFSKKEKYVVSVIQELPFCFLKYLWEHFQFSYYQRGTTIFKIPFNLSN